MKKIRLGLLLVALSTLPFHATVVEAKYVFKSESDAATEKLISELANMFSAAQITIFKNQPLINAKGGDKSSLFGDAYLAQVKIAYSDKFGTPFPEMDHPFKVQLQKSMLEVMRDNATLVNDPDLGFKGLIPASYAFQLSHNFSKLGLGVKIKFTAPKNLLRNQFNAPDAWEQKKIEQFSKAELEKGKPYFDANAQQGEVKSFRYIVPLYHTGFCLNCHGVPANNPMNKDKPEDQWTKFDVSGFPMEGLTDGTLAGGVSVSIPRD